MEKVYKHKKTGETITYKDGVIKAGNCSIETGVEPSSEFWTELTYEILSFRSHRNRFYNPTIQKDGTYLDAEIMEFDGNGASLEWMLNEYEYYITSVKRLSDGEVFSIGDKINFRGLYGNNSEHKYDTIRGFDLKQDANLGILYHNGLVGLSKIEKYKEPILTTFDGVELFNQDVYYFIWLNKPAHGQEINKVYKAIVRDLEEDTSWSSDAVFFSTKESAEEYILMNKPLLSLNDLLSVWGNDDSFDVYKESPMFQDFKNLAKTKL